MFTCSVILTWPCFLEVTSWIPRSLKRELLVINGIGVFTGLLLNYVKALKRSHKPAKGFYSATVFWGGCHTAYANCPCSRCIYALVVKTLFLVLQSFCRHYWIFLTHYALLCVFIYCRYVKMFMNVDLSSNFYFRLVFNIFTVRCYASAVYAMALCLSVTSRCSTKMAEHRIT